MIILGNVINGRTVASPINRPFYNPATGTQIGCAPDANAAEVDQAVQAATTAFSTWKKSTPGDRQRALLRLADLVEAHVEDLLDAEVACTGKPRAVTRQLEILRGADQLRFFAGAARVSTGLVQTEYEVGYTSSVRREPIGVVGQITPWNYPFMMTIWKIGPALAAGNTIVLKPAETTPWSTVLLAELATQVLPPGVFNVICGGRETGSALVAHPVPELVAITGSTRAGSQVMKSAADTLKDVHLELGGKAPALVFADVDPAVTAKAIVTASFFNAGQDCTAITRVLAHQDIYPELLAHLVKHTQQLRVGGPTDSAADLGPLNSAEHQARVQGFFDRLPPHVTVATGGTTFGPGFFVEPTVLADVTSEDEVVRDELFAPVITVQPFTDEAEAVALANDSVYALASSVWSRDVGLVHRVVADLDFGAVWVNCHQVLPAEVPHGGFKQSGIGKDLSILSVESYQRLKAVTVAHQ